MLRAGSRHPDVDDAGASTSAHEETNMAANELPELYAALNEFLLLEQKFQPRLCLPSESENGEVTTGARDGAAHVLRCLKVWFDLPADVLITAVNLFDRFLTKMKVRPCHVPCITVACMNIALEHYCKQQNTPPKVSILELVSISQSACTVGDVARMSQVISDKLGVSASAPHTALTSLTCLRLLTRVFTAAKHQLQLPPMTKVEESELVNLLEIVTCDAVCASARLSELALVLLYYKLEEQMVLWSETGVGVPEHAYYLFDIGAQLQAHCRMSDASLAATRARVAFVLARYESRTAAPQRQRLVWRLSSRTLRVLRPTDRLHTVLPTIQEQRDPSSPIRNRSGSESSESEETCDWPRSPVLPVYCDN